MTAGLRRAQAKLRQFGNSAGAVGKRLLTIGTVAAAPFALATKIFAGFDDQMQSVRAITGASQDQFEKLTAKMKELGRTTSFTASEVAGAAVELGRAGFKPDEIDASIASILSLARATGTELPRAAEIAGNTLRGFNLDTSEAGRVADVLTAAANNSAQTLDDLAEGMKFVAPLAYEAGASIEDTAAAIGILANNGLKGTVAGTALARAFKNLSNSTIAEKVHELGIATEDANGNLLPMSNILADLGKKTQKLGSAKRLAIFEEIFGRGSQAAAILARSGAQFDDLLEKLKESQGVADKTAETMDSGIGGAIRRLLSAVEGVAIAIGDSLKDVLSKLADQLSAVTGRITEFINANKEIVVTTVKIIAAVIAVGAGLIGLGLVLKAAAFGVGVLSVAIKAALVSFALLKVALVALTSPITLVIVAIAGIGLALANATGATDAAIKYLSSSFSTLKDIVGTTFAGIADALAANDLQLAAKILWAGLKVIFTSGVNELEKVWIGIKDFILEKWNDAFYGVQVILVEAGSGIMKTWANIVAGLKSLWATFTNFLGSTQESAVNGLAKVWLRLGGAINNALAKVGLVDQTFDVKKSLELADQQSAANQRKIRSETASTIADAEAEKQKELARIEDERKAKLAEIAQTGSESDTKRQQDNAAKLKALDDEKAALQAELNNLRNQAKSQKDTRDKNASIDKTLDEFFGEVEKAVQKKANLAKDSAASGVDSALALGGKTAGLFNATAISRIFGSGVESKKDEDQKKTREAAEKTEKNIRRMTANSDKLLKKLNTP